jgi:hypothetical protein
MASQSFNDAIYRQVATTSVNLSIGQELVGTYGGGAQRFGPIVVKAT